MKINLRDFIQNDRQYFAKWWRDEELINLTSGDHTFLDNEEIQRQTQEMIDDPNSHHWMIEMDSKTVGHINLNKISGSKAEMQIVIGEKDYWGKGIGQEASIQVFQETKNLGFNKIYIEVRPDNSRAIALYQKLGFKNLGLKKYPENKNLSEVVVMEKAISNSY